MAEKKKIKGIQYGQFRLVKADDLNYGLDKLNEKGTYFNRQFYPSLKLAVSAMIEKCVLSDKEVETLKALSEQIEKAKLALSKEIIKAKLK